MKYINPYKIFNGSFIPDWLERRTEITPGAKLVYGRLARFAGKDGKCNPPLELMAECLGTNPRQIIRHIKELTNANLIESKRNGRGKPNDYFFIYHDWMTFRSDKSSLVEMPDLSPVEVTNGHFLYKEEENHLRESIKKDVDSEGIDPSPSLNKIVTDKDFEDRWQKYPMKDGKKEARRHWNASVKTPSDLLKFDKAFENYLSHLAANPWKPPKNGKTFFNNWLDWLEWNEPVKTKPKMFIPKVGQPDPYGEIVTAVYAGNAYKTQSGAQYTCKNGKYQLYKEGYYE
ncbi:MAG: hypothetical protein CV087_24315 [Candidatus Brocadia sp. WS118]|nr:MAG: hypothetical protein CV087_24315 [Candidatus Brocadia sp. WS118]